MVFKTNIGGYRRNSFADDMSLFVFFEGLSQALGPTVLINRPPVPNYTATRFERYVSDEDGKLSVVSSWFSSGV